MPEHAVSFCIIVHSIWMTLVTDRCNYVITIEVNDEFKIVTPKNIYTRMLTQSQSFSQTTPV